MADRSATQDQVLRAFKEHDREKTVSNFKVACVIGMVLMPAGLVLDIYKYESLAGRFLVMRLVSSVLIGALLGVLVTNWGRKHYQFLGITLFMVPASFIAAMIYMSPQGAASPYYAGLNLVLLVLAFVLRWTFRESLEAAMLVLVLYIAASLPSGIRQHLGDFVNNLFFLSCTALVAVTGSYFHTRSRLREFIANYELAESRKELEQTNKKLLEMDEVKSRFFANISHELRTPLTLLLAPLETILHRHGAQLDEQTKSMLLTMHSNGMRLLKLINDLLDLVRLESGKIEVKTEPVAFENFIQGLLSGAKQVANDKRVLLESRVPADVGTVLADKDKLEKIFLNLVFNALKFTSAGGRVTVSASKRESTLVLSVEDTGMGIPEKSLPYVFDRFWQADGSPKRKFQGAGIGLALVKELTEVQGGRVSVESREGHGTTFTIELPFVPCEPLPTASDDASLKTGAPLEAQSPEEWLTTLYHRAELFPGFTTAQDAPAPAGIDSGDGPSVLIADDEPDMLRFLTSQLGSHYRVIPVVDGQIAVEKACENPPELVVLDMMMPRKDGLQACKEIRQNDSTQNTPIIILTARADEETKLACLRAGASDFLAKPFSITELHVRVKNLLENHSFQKELARKNGLLEQANGKLKNTIELLKSTEAQLVQSEKLNSLGVMSAGIMHEINNPLNWAMTGLYTLRNKGDMLPPADREEYLEYLKDVEEGLQRVKKIVSDLRSFAHKDNVGRDQVDVAEAVDMALRFLSHELDLKVHVERRISDNQAVWANRNMLVQVILNLVQNSAQALASKQFPPGEHPTIVIEGKVERGFSIIRVQDNGPGIAPENESRVFEPFFTTKDVGRGMGLGLSISYRIVQEFEGKIRLESELGKYCAFILEFPQKGAVCAVPEPPRVVAS